MGEGHHHHGHEHHDHEHDHDHDHAHHARYADRTHPEFVVLEIGGELGALIIYTDADMHGREVEISPTGDDGKRSHKDVLERSLGSTPAFSAVFDQIPDGSYTLWVDDVARSRRTWPAEMPCRLGRAMSAWPAERSASSTGAATPHCARPLRRTPGSPARVAGPLPDR